MTVQELEFLLSPRSIGVVGVSRSGAGWGASVIRRLRDFGFTGDLYGIGHPVDALPAQFVGQYADLPDAVDLLIVAVPAQGVADVVEDARGIGACRSVLVFSSGFAELDDVGREREEALRAAAGSLPLLGPNCLGLVNRSDVVYASMSQYLGRPHLPPPGRVGIVSQSGALGFVLAHQMERFGVGFSQYVSVGNEACLDSAQVGRYLITRDDVSVLGLYIEAVRDAQGLAQLAEDADRLGKTIVALKTGQSDASQRATLSHTAAVAGDPLLFEAFCRQHGIVQANSDESFADLLVALQRKVRLRRGSRAAVLTMSGGAGALLCDRLTSVGIQVPELDEGTQEAIEALRLKGLAGKANPIDLGGQSRESHDRLGDLLDMVANNDGVDCIVAYFTFGDDIPDAYAEIARRVDGLAKPGWMIWAGQPGVLPEVPPGVVMGSIEQMARVAGGLATVDGGFEGAHAGTVGDMFVQEIQTEAQTWEMLVDAGVPYVETRVFEHWAEASTSDLPISDRYVVKLDTRDELHRARAGLLRLDVRAEEVKGTAQELWQRSEGLTDRRIVIQPQLAPGTELSLGLIRSVQYGLVMIAGPGGGRVEDASANRVALACPASEATVIDFCLRLCKLAPNADQKSLRSIVEAVQTLGISYRNLESMDINPLIVARDGSIVAVDSLIIGSRQQSSQGG